MPRVLRIINRFNLGGPTYNAAYLTKYLEPEYETLLVGGEKDESEADSFYILDQLGIKPVIVPEMRRSINPNDDIVAYRKLKQLIQDFKPDIVHTHASKAGTLGRMAAFSCGVPIVVHTFHGHVFHSYFNRFKTAFFKNVERRLAKKCSCIVAISPNQKKELGAEHKISSLDRIKVIPLGFDLSRFNENREEKRSNFRKLYQLADDEIAVGIIGRLVPVKNHEFFLDAVAKVLGQTTKKVKFFIIGDGEDREALKVRAAELSIPTAIGNFSNSDQRLVFTSWIKEIDVVTAGLDVIALSSLNEGTPVSLIEAQAANRPIVSTNVGGIENIVLKNETALLSEVGDLEGYAKNLLSLLEDDQRRIRMGKKGWDHVNERFSHLRLAADMRKLYSELYNG